MTLYLNIISCLPSEYLTTVQIRSSSQVLFIRTLKGQDGLDIQSIDVCSTPKYALMSHKFKVSELTEGLQILVAWQKERKFTEWKYLPKELTDISSCYYIAKDGVFHRQCDSTEVDMDIEASKFADWQKVKKIEEIRSCSGKIVEIICTPRE